MKILIVDDEKYLRELLSEVLQSHSHECETAGDGEEALTKLDQSRFDVVITDAMMPNMDGFTLLKNIKKTYPETAVVVITGYSLAYSARDAMAIGAEEYLAKPFHTDEILAVVEKAYRLKGGDDAGRKTLTTAQ